ncbi:serine/threonine protein kinase [Trichophyton equinum CBS 127.97]|uniref:Serine/threonine protein kinase n=1 Tax=Trichophyton equinum (strain ATCC MYA-4606 / CBS 127.97) TaxID=559882 RepID=F2Q629_TRIEC|nr:serine/threonine protein kinase [Trichophyton equinum CBS 127.97]
MSRLAFSPALIHLSGTRRTGRTLCSELLFRKLICPITFSAPVHTDTQHTLTGAPQSAARMTSIGTRIVGESGSQYIIERLLQEKQTPDIRVYLANNGTEKFILKNVYDFDYYHDLYRRLSSSPCLRLLHDTVPNQSMFVYEYLTDHLLNMAKKDIPLMATKRILRDTLRGLKGLHDQNIVHTDIKANNIMVDWKEENGEIVITRVQLVDIEDSAIIPPNCDILGKAVGNWMWRSPEAHVEARVNKPSDIFSFGNCVYLRSLKACYLAVDAKRTSRRCGRSSNVSSVTLIFGNDESIAALLKHMGDDSPWCTVINVLWKGFDETTPRDHCVV